MALRIRLSRAGAKKRPFYRIVVADSRRPRDGRYIERLGTYNPLLSKDSEERVKLNVERIRHWLGHGAKPSDRVARFLDEADILKRAPRHNPEKGKPGKRAIERAAAEKEAKVAAKEDAKKAAEEAAKAPAPEPEAPAPEPEAEAPAEEAKTEEAPAEEAKTEETPAEEVKAEEAPAEEAKTEEAPAEEAKTEEAPAEETKTEEAAAEETPAEEAEVEVEPETKAKDAD